MTVRVVAGERLVGEVLVGALRAILGERAAVDLVDRAAFVAQEPSAGHVVIDVDDLELSVYIDRFGGNDQPGAPPVPARVSSLHQLAGVACPGTSHRVHEPPAHRFTSSGAGRLTERELEVLGEMRRGSADSAIAASLDISVHTVRSHVGNIMRKQGARSRVKAITR